MGFTEILGRVLGLEEDCLMAREALTAEAGGGSY